MRKLIWTFCSPKLKRCLGTLEGPERWVNSVSKVDGYTEIAYISKCWWLRPSFPCSISTILARQLGSMGLVCSSRSSRYVGHALSMTSHYVLCMTCVCVQAPRAFRIMASSESGMMTFYIEEITDEAEILHDNEGLDSETGVSGRSGAGKTRGCAAVGKEGPQVKHACLQCPILSVVVRNQCHHDTTRGMLFLQCGIATLKILPQGHVITLQALGAYMSDSRLAYNAVLWPRRLYLTVRTRQRGLIQSVANLLGTQGRQTRQPRLLA